MSKVVGNPEKRFTHDTALLIVVHERASLSHYLKAHHTNYGGHSRISDND